MKRFFIAAMLLSSVYGYGQQSNTMLNADFWKKNPDLTSVKAEIAKGNNPAESNSNSFDVVTMAINNKANLEVVKYLIDLEGNGFKKKTHNSRSYLHWAASSGNAELVEYLIAKGSDIHHQDSHGMPIAAFAAGGNKNTKVFDLLFKAGVDPKQRYDNGATLMMLAIAGDPELKMADYFASKGMWYKDKDANGATLVDYAARQGNIALMEKLMQKGIQPTHYALFFASQGGRNASNGLDTFKYLVETLKLNPKAVNHEGATLLHNFVKRPNKEIIAYFLEKGIDLTLADNDGNTILMNAAAGKDLDLVKELVGSVNNIQAVNKAGESALTKAVSSGSEEIVSYLLEKGAGTDLKNANGENLAFYWFKSLRVTPSGFGTDAQAKLDILKAKGVDFTAADNNGTTLLHLAVAKESLPLIRKAIELGIDINAQDKEGTTALHKAALIAKDDQILKELIHLGAKKDIANEFEEKAFDLAAENDFLKSNKVNIDFLK